MKTNFLFILVIISGQLFAQSNQLELKIDPSNMDNSILNQNDLSEERTIELPMANPLYLERGLVKKIYDEKGLSIVVDGNGETRAIEISLATHPLELIAVSLPTNFYKGIIRFGKKNIEFTTSREAFERTYQVKEQFTFLDYVYYSFGDHLVRIVYKNNNAYIAEFAIMFNEAKRNKFGWSTKEIAFQKVKILNSEGITAIITYCENNGIDDDQLFLECCLQKTSNQFTFQKYYYNDYDKEDDRKMNVIMEECIRELR